APVPSPLRLYARKRTNSRRSRDVCFAPKATIVAAKTITRSARRRERAVCELWPPDDCRVFCSNASVQCPPIQNVPPAHSAIHQNGGFGGLRTLFGPAAEHDGGHPAAPVRCHDDEIAASVRGRCNNGLIGLHVLHLHRVAGHTGLLSCGGRPPQHIRG